MVIEGSISPVNITLNTVYRFYLPPSPYQTAGGLRGKKGWFTEREEVSSTDFEWEVLASNCNRLS